MPISQALTSKDYYVYALAYPDGDVFYIGKGQGDRIDAHEKEAKTAKQSVVKNPAKCDVIRKIWNSGGEVQKTILFRTSNEREAFMYEWALINMTCMSSRLTNKHPGRFDPPVKRAPREVQGKRNVTITYNGQTYITAGTAARKLNLAIATFLSNVAPRLRQYEFEGLRRIYYLQSDVDARRGPREVRPE